MSSALIQYLTLWLNLIFDQMPGWQPTYRFWCVLIRSTQVKMIKGYFQQWAVLQVIKSSECRKRTEKTLSSCLTEYFATRSTATVRFYTSHMVQLDWTSCANAQNSFAVKPRGLRQIRTTYGKLSSKHIHWCGVQIHAYFLFLENYS